jgi:site-specific recombinase XerC
VTAVAGTVQAFFTERLIGQRRASPHTVAAYRDAIRLLLNFAAERTGAVPCRLDFTDLDAPVISAFLDHIERERGNTIRSRNARLAAIHSLFSFAALRHPEHAADIERVLAIPPSGPTRRSSRSSPPPRPKPFSPPQTSQPGQAAVTMPGCCSRSRPGCGPPSSPP